MGEELIWATSWQNQQNGMCAQWRLRSAWASAQSDQSLRCPHEESWDPYLPIECTAKTLIRLGGCPGWSESSLGAESFCWFCHEAAHMRKLCVLARVRTHDSWIWHAVDCPCRLSNVVHVLVLFVNKFSFSICKLSGVQRATIAHLSPNVCLCWGFTAQSITRSCRASRLIVVLFLGRLRPSKRLTNTKRGRPRQ